MRRRTVLASLATAVTPALAGCSPCGETWTAVGWTVSPTNLRRTDDAWEVTADSTVSFSFGFEGAGVHDAHLTAFADDGQILGRDRLGSLTWDDVPEESRTETDCGDHGEVTRSGSLEVGQFPRWIGLRYERASDAIDEPRTVARYDGTPSEDATANGYEVVGVSDAVGEEPTLPPGVDDRTRFGRVRPPCEEYPTLDVTTRYGLSVRGVRRLPAEHFHPVLADAVMSGDRVRLDVGLRAWPRFRRVPCLSEGYSVAIETDDDLPDAIDVRHLSTDGEVVETETVRREAAVTASRNETGPARSPTTNTDSSG